MSDAWCADCGAQHTELFPVWAGTHQRWVCWDCALGYSDDAPELPDEAYAEYEVRHG